MNLWIRTQDRAGILKCEKLYIQVLNGEFHILNENEFPLGIYETRGKALEVLDEIQKILTPETILNKFCIEKKDMLNNNQYLMLENNIKDISIKYFDTYVYEMPKD